MRSILIGLAGACVLGAASILWLTWPGDGDRPRRGMGGVADVAGAVRPEAAGVEERRGSAREPSPKKKAEAARVSQIERVRSEVAAREPRVPDRQERAAVRVETRDELVSGLLDRIEAHARTAGWTDDRLGQVEDTVLEATAAIGEALHRVDVGEANWEDVKREVRQLRLDQAEALRAVLGEDAFEDFVAAVALERFEGEEPVRGRL